MRVLVDADLVLERFLQRSKFLEKAKNLFKQILVSENLEAYITDIGLEKIAKISSKLATKNKINAESLIINQLQNKYKFKVFKVDQDILNKARKFDLIDFESAVELTCAIAGNFDGIITEYSPKFGNYINLVDILSVTELEKKFLDSIYEKEPTMEVNKGINILINGDFGSLTDAQIDQLYQLLKALFSSRRQPITISFVKEGWDDLI